MRNKCYRLLCKSKLDLCIKLNLVACGGKIQTNEDLSCLEAKTFEQHLDSRVWRGKNIEETIFKRRRGKSFENSYFGCFKEEKTTDYRDVVLNSYQFNG